MALPNGGVLFRQKIADFAHKLCNYAKHRRSNSLKICQQLYLIGYQVSPKFGED